MKFYSILLIVTYSMLGSATSFEAVEETLPSTSNFLEAPCQSDWRFVEETREECPDGSPMVYRLSGYMQRVYVDNNGMITVQADGNVPVNCDGTTTWDNVVIHDPDAITIEAFQRGGGDYIRSLAAPK